MPKLLDLATRRASIRAFSRDPIHLADVIYAIRVAHEAPSGANRQPWRFLIVTDDHVKSKIRHVCELAEREFHKIAPSWFKNWLRDKGISWRKPFLTDAPVLVLIFFKKDEPYASESTWLAIGYLILALEERGLASLTYTPSRSEDVNEVLNVPKAYCLAAIIPIGHPLCRKAKEPRTPLKRLCFLNTWGNPLTESEEGEVELSG